MTTGATIGLEIDGLLETVRASARMERTIEREGIRAMRQDAREVVREARSILERRPGGGTYKRMPADVGVIGERVVLRRGGTMIGAEFGASRAWVFGRVLSQGELSRRQYPPSKRSGYVVGPIYNESRKVVERTAEMEEELMRSVVTKSLRAEGVPR